VATEIPKRLAAILAADIAGYTRLMESDEEGTVDAWRRARAEVIDPTIAAHRGRIVKLTGDGFLAEFPTVESAVKAALAMQARFAALFGGAPPEHRTAFRMGANVGDIFVDSDDIYGTGVNIAARLQALAEPGGLCISASVYDAVKHKIAARYEDMGLQRVKNVADPIRAWRVHIEQPTTVVQSRDEPRAANLAASTGRKLTFGVIGLSVLVLALGFVAVDQYLLDGPAAAPVVVPRLAVLPCENQSPDASDAYFAAQMHEEVVNQLGKLSGLRVIGRSSVMQYAANRPAIRQIARELNANAILECTVRYAGDDIRVSANLIDPRTDEQLWSEAYPGNIGDVRAIFAMQSSIAMNIANALNTEYSTAEQTRIAQAPTESGTAYALFLEARDYYNANSTDLPEILERVDRALAADPTYAQALGFRAFVRGRQLINSVAVTVDSAARESLRREIEAEITEALALDPSVTYAWLARAYVASVSFRWSSADAAFTEALRLAPSDPDTMREYAGLKAWRREAAEAQRLMVGVAELAPNDFLTLQFQMNVAAWTGEIDAAVAASSRLVDLDPSFGPSRGGLGQLQIDSSRRAEAEGNLRAAEGLIAPNPAFRAFLPGIALGYRRLGLTGDARRVHDRYVAEVASEAIGAGDRLMLSLAVDDVEQAFEALNTSRARIERGEIDPGFFAIVNLMTGARRGPDGVLDEPRFRNQFDRIYEVAMSR
jgi:class 3 adenylate cyclase/TolB-like protein